MSARRNSRFLIAVAAAAAVVGCADQPSAPAAPPKPGQDTSDIAGPLIRWAAPKPPGPLDQFGDGTYEVLTDIKPGKYKTAGASPGPDKCYWARLKDLNGLVTSSIAIGYGNKGPDVVVIQPGDKGFESRACGVWRLQP